MPVLGALLSIIMLSACQPIDGLQDGCQEFAKTFQSVSVDLSILGSDYLNDRIPEGLSRVEAGYDPSCIVGGLGDIHIQCVTDNEAQSYAVVRKAPVVWTDPEGFTVLFITDEDNENLKGQELFWAKCEAGT